MRKKDCLDTRDLSSFSLLHPTSASSTFTSTKVETIRELIKSLNHACSTTCILKTISKFCKAFLQSGLIEHSISVETCPVGLSYITYTWFRIEIIHFSFQSNTRNEINIYYGWIAFGLFYLVFYNLFNKKVKRFRL